MPISSSTKPRSFVPVHTTTAQGELLILTLRPGSITLPDQIQDFNCELRAFASKHPNVDAIVDFHQVPHISLAALTQLIVFNNSIQLEGGILQICGLSEEICDLLLATGLNGLFCLQPDLRHAFARYASAHDQSVA